jgi:hypothetical protein
LRNWTLQKNLPQRLRLQLRLHRQNHQPPDGLRLLWLPGDTLEHFQEKIAQVTQADVLAAARKHLKPGHLAIMVVGNPEKFDQPLSVLGQVKTWISPSPEQNNSGKTGP